MTDEELSRLIAEFLEPIETLPGYDGNGIPYRSPYWNYGVWINGRPDEPKPRDIVNDPKLTMLLLEKLTYGEYGVMLVCREDQLYAVQTREGDRVTTVRNPSLGRAIAETYAITHKLTVPATT